MLPPQPVFAHVDAARITQIVGNLLHNAWKFTGKGGRIEVVLEIENVDASVPCALIRVRDTGIGIAAEQLPRVFEMFQQVDASLDRTAGGLGIGLTLARNLAEMHGGTLEAKSDGIGSGTEIVLRLPMRPGVTPGAVVADTAREEPMPEVVLLDLGLPKLDGYEVARRIRAREGEEKRSVLIAVTGWGQVEDRRQSEAAGFDAHTVKPVDPEKLVRLMVAYQPPKRLRRTAVNSPEEPDR